MARRQDLFKFFMSITEDELFRETFPSRSPIPREFLSSLIDEAVTRLLEEDATEQQIEGSAAKLRFLLHELARKAAPIDRPNR
jgi:hypothetical protein